MEQTQLEAVKHASSFRHLRDVLNVSDFPIHVFLITPCPDVGFGQLEMQKRTETILNRSSLMIAALHTANAERQSRCQGMTLFSGSKESSGGGLWCGVEVSQEEACDHFLMMPSLKESHLGFAF